MTSVVSPVFPILFLFCPFPSSVVRCLYLKINNIKRRRKRHRSPRNVIYHNRYRESYGEYINIEVKPCRGLIRESVIGFRQACFGLSEWTTLIVYKWLLKLIHSLLEVLHSLPSTNPICQRCPSPDHPFFVTSGFHDLNLHERCRLPLGVQQELVYHLHMPPT